MAFRIDWSDALATELRRTRGELGHIQGSCMTCVLCTARKVTDVIQLCLSNNLHVNERV